MKRLIDWFTSVFNPYSVLTHKDIEKLIDDGYLIANKDKINATSIDVTLHEEYMIESTQTVIQTIDLAAKETPRFLPKIMKVSRHCSVNLKPNEFILGATREIFNLPDNVTAVYYLKSSLARCGLDHSNAGFIDPGFNDSRLTLELKNLLQNNNLKLTAGMPIGQIKFYRHKFVPKEFSYRKTGQYNGDKVVQDSKGLR